MKGINIDTTRAIEYILPDRKTVCSSFFKKVEKPEELYKGKHLITDQIADNKTMLPILLEFVKYTDGSSNHIKTKEGIGHPAYWTCFIEVEDSFEDNAAPSWKDGRESYIAYGEASNKVN